MKYFWLTATIAGFLAAPALAQKWEIGGGAGGSFFTSQDVVNGTVSGSATLANGVNASFWLDNNTGRLFGGELRYDYEHTKLKVSSSGSEAGFGADTHAVHYDFLLHFTPPESHIRPYIAAGGGVKVYRGIEQESAFQPLSNLALLTKTNQVEGLLSVGAGLKIALSSAVQLRLEAHDYLTPFPKSVIAPAEGSKINGWIQDFALTAGISATL